LTFLLIEHCRQFGRRSRDSISLSKLPQQATRVVKAR